MVSASVLHQTGDLSQGSYTYTYDAFGRTASITAPDQRVTQIDYMSNVFFPPSQQQLFGDASDLATEATVRTEPNGLQEISVVNHRGQPVRVIQSNAADNGAAGTTSHYTYGVFGRLYDTTDPDGEVTTISYDKIGRRVGLGNATNGATAFALNNFDEVSGETDANGNTRCYTYDSLGRPVQLTQGNLDGTCSAMGSLIAWWTYDGSGDNELDKLVQSFRAVNPGDSSGTIQRYYYEPKPSGTTPNTGRLQSVEQDMPNTSSLVTSLEYNGPWVSKLHYPNPTADGNDVVLTYTRDTIGTVTGVSGNGVSYWQLTQVDQGQRIKQEQFGSGTVTSYDYYAPNTAAGQRQCTFPGSVSCMPGALHSMTTALPGDQAGNPTKELQYAYDNAGYLWKIQDVQKTTEEQYFYDVYGRLQEKGDISQAGLVRDTSWQYTGSGDVLSVSTGDMMAHTGTTQYYTYYTVVDDNGRRHLLDHITDTQGNTLTLGYDNKGNTNSRTGPPPRTALRPG